VILVDTSVWIDHLRKPEPRLIAALEAGQTLTHPFVVGELACDNLKNRVELLSLLLDLPRAPVATDAEALDFIDRRELRAAVSVASMFTCSPRPHSPAPPLWTRDKRLAAVAEGLRLNFVACG
jgi:predicted nucleic acid-binding protein